MTGKTPDITVAQILAVVTSIVGMLVSDQVLDGHTAKVFLDLAAVVLPAAWVIGDAIIRHGRSRAMLNQDPTR